MNRCSFCEWIPILPWPLWPLAGQFSLGQNVVVGSMTLRRAGRGKHCHEQYVWTPVRFTSAPYHGLVWSYPLPATLANTSIAPPQHKDRIFALCDRMRRSNDTREGYTD